MTPTRQQHGRAALACVELLLATHADTGDERAQHAVEVAVERLAHRLSDIAEGILTGPRLATAPPAPYAAPEVPGLPVPDLDPAGCERAAAALRRARGELDAVPGGEDLGRIAADLDALASALDDLADAAKLFDPRRAGPTIAHATRRLAVVAESVR